MSILTSFGNAMTALKAHHGIRLPKWDKGTFIVANHRAGLKNSDASVLYEEVKLFMVKEDKFVGPYLYTADDLVEWMKAPDWEIISNARRPFAHVLDRQVTEVNHGNV